MNGAPMGKGALRGFGIVLQAPVSRPAFPGPPAHTPAGPALRSPARLGYGGGVGTQQVWVYSSPHGRFAEAPASQAARWRAGH